MQNIVHIALLFSHLINSFIIVSVNIQFILALYEGYYIIYKYETILKCPFSVSDFLNLCIGYKLIIYDWK